MAGRFIHAIDLCSGFGTHTRLTVAGGRIDDRKSHVA
jgi:hypothetical protein